MDNGLIFPYPLTRAHAEPTDTNRTNLLSAFGPVAVGECVDLRW